MDKRDLCSNITVIPQYEGTCWFNAILMICFYSQAVRKLLIKHSNEWEKNESLFKLFKTILKYSHTKSTKTLDLFIKVKPEIVLLKIMDKYDNMLKDIFTFKNKNKQIQNLSWGYNMRYICEFLKLVKVPYISINYISSVNKFMFNLPELTTLWFYLEQKEKAYTYTDVQFKEYLEEIRKTIENKPEVIIINEGVGKYDSLKYHKDFNKFFLNDFKLKYTDYNSIRNLNEIIIFNGTKYKLDSCICVNYNKTIENNYHAIAGITCNDNKYVYNGWNSLTSDGGLKNTLNVSESPCSLMKFDWDIHKNSEFCLNLAECKLDPNIIDKNELCFNFANKTSGRLLVYVKINDNANENENEIKSFESVRDLSEKKDLIEKLYKVDTLDLTEIINLISKFNFHFHDLIKHKLVILKDIILYLINSFENIDYKNNKDKIKQIIFKYNPNAVINDNMQSYSYFYGIYIENFFYKHNTTIIIKDADLLLSEIKQYNFKLPKFYTIVELNQILFNLKKIEGDLHYFQFFFDYHSNDFYTFKDKVYYLLNLFEKISIYYPKKFRSSDKVILKNLAKQLLNDVYLIRNKSESKVVLKEQHKATKTKVTKEPKAKVTKEPKAKVTKEPKAKVTKEPKAKVTKEPKAKVTKETKAKVTKETKATIIEKLKKLKPELTGLQNKKKEELLILYTKLRGL